MSLKARLERLERGFDAVGDFAHLTDDELHARIDELMQQEGLYDRFGPSMGWTLEQEDELRKILDLESKGDE